MEIKKRQKAVIIITAALLGVCAFKAMNNYFKRDSLIHKFNFSGDGRTIRNYDSLFINSKSDLLILSAVQVIPVDLAEQTQLRKLIIIGNDCDYGSDCKGIGEMPAYFGKFRNLEALTFAVSGMRFIPDTLKSLYRLKILCLPDNSALTNISAVKYLPDIEELSFYGCNSLKNIVPDIAQLKKLKSLGLVGCTGISQNELAAIRKVVPENCSVTY